MKHLCCLQIEIQFCLVRTEIWKKAGNHTGLLWGKINTSGEVSFCFGLTEVLLDFDFREDLLELFFGVLVEPFTDGDSVLPCSD